MFVVDAKHHEIHYSDSLNWPWPSNDVDQICQWLQHHSFVPFSKGLALPHGMQDDSYSCTIAMVNIIHHHLFSNPLFSYNRKEFLCIQDLLYLLCAHINIKDQSYPSYLRPSTAPDNNSQSKSKSLCSAESPSPSLTSPPGQKFPTFKCSCAYGD
ncbi:hypothetical protein PAXRUDRAFT_149438 [Paxillus rubicundulus Ve08.2h10]|uniref:Ubiquitin-like protease family profile domain-containing protein n=1 Tax=Paxillus rubicundulus Ve08.2h10 TaxID=930991 RepID=A0A0D0DSY8_9AGAM|nr:hypothetical protein PAXRUDRAFT_149438 [Paxillus rubicundulus Ve08.2h10]